MPILPSGYRFDALPGGHVLIAPRGEIVSAFYSPDHPDTATIAAYHALGYAHGRRALHELREPLERLLFEARALAARGEQPALGTAIQLVQRALDATAL